MNWFNLTLISLLFLTQDSTSTPRPKDLNNSFHCHRTVYALQDFDSGTTAAIAPNHSDRILLAKDYSFRVMRGQTEIGSVQIKDLSSNIEILWAPDSKKFAITYSDGGAEGAFHAHIYELSHDGVKEFPKPVRVAFDDFKTHDYCKKRGNNVFVEGWTSDSRSVFVVTEVFPTGDCGRKFGKLGGYFMDLQGQILSRYNNKQTALMQKSWEKTGSTPIPPVVVQLD
jgi:hypothetical protein